MLVALYEKHDHLPFWRSPRQPEEIFDEKKHATRLITVNTYQTVALYTPIWQVLLGLSDIKDVHDVMAHVSAYAGCADGARYYARRAWVQISTMSPVISIQGIPLIVSPNGTVLVEHVWGGDNGTYSPYELIPKNLEHVEHNRTFWAHFFKRKVHEARTRAIERVNTL